MKKYGEYALLVYTTIVNSTFRACWLASSEVISQVLFTSEQPQQNKMTFVAIFSQIKILFGPLDIQLVWYILKQLFTSVSVKVVDNIHHYSPPLRWIIVNYYLGSSVNEQDNQNRALWLATRVGTIEPSCPLGNTRCIPQANLPRKPYNKSLID